MSNELIPAAALQALLAAPPDRVEAALRVLRGDSLDPAGDRPLLYTVTDAAKRLNVSRSTVWRIIRAGRLTKIEIYPGCERLRRADIEALASGAAP